MLIAGQDTALVNNAIVLLRENGTPHGEFLWAGKPTFSEAEGEDSFFNTHARVRMAVAWAMKTLKDGINSFVDARVAAQFAPIFFAFEDYPMTNNQRSYKNAEMHGALKERLWDARYPYCLVHNLKTKKYVEKKLEITKSESIAFCKLRQPEVLASVQRKWHSDVAEAWIIAQIGMMVYQARSQPDPIAFTKKHLTWEPRWKEILLGDTGILEKLGLVQWEYPSIT